jgi:hypothetical protein
VHDEIERISDTKIPKGGAVERSVERSVEL